MKVHARLVSPKNKIENEIILPLFVWPLNVVDIPRENCEHLFHNSD